MFNEIAQRYVKLQITRIELEAAENAVKRNPGSLYQEHLRLKKVVAEYETKLQSLKIAQAVSRSRLGAYTRKLRVLGPVKAPAAKPGAARAKPSKPEATFAEKREALKDIGDRADAKIKKIGEKEGPKVEEAIQQEINRRYKELFPGPEVSTASLETLTLARANAKAKLKAANKVAQKHKGMPKESAARVEVTKAEVAVEHAKAEITRFKNAEALESLRGLELGLGPRRARAKIEKRVRAEQAAAQEVVRGRFIKKIYNRVTALPYVKGQPFRNVFRWSGNMLVYWLIARILIATPFILAGLLTEKGQKEWLDSLEDVIGPDSLGILGATPPSEEREMAKRKTSAKQVPLSRCRALLKRAGDLKANEYSLKDLQGMIDDGTCSSLPPAAPGKKKRTKRPAGKGGYRYDLPSPTVPRIPADGTAGPTPDQTPVPPEKTKKTRRSDKYR